MISNPLIDAEESRYIVPALERGLLILSQFSREQRSCSAPQLAQVLQLPRSTVFRLLNTLESMGFVEKTEGGREYKLALGVLRLGFEYLASLDLTELGNPVVNRLCQRVGHAVNLVVRDGRHIVYISKATSSTNPFIGAASVGTRLPAHATVLGQVVLSDLDLEQLKNLYPDIELKSFTKHTPKNVHELCSRTAQVREQAYAIGEGYYEAHISTIAAPIFNHSGHVVAALGVTLGSPLIEPSQRSRLLSSVREAAKELSALLDYVPARQHPKVHSLRTMQ